MKMLKKTKVDCCRSTCSELTLQEALENYIEKYYIPKVTQETLLAELNEIFLPYWSNSLDNIITVPVTDATKLPLKMIPRWSEEVKSWKDAGTANVRLMENLQAIRVEIDSAKEEIA